MINHPTREEILHTGDVLAEGGIAIFPTDTAFGIGCRIDRDDSLKRLFTIRKRPLNQAIPVLVSSVEMALRYFDNPSGETVKLMRTYWPGALTVISSCKKEHRLTYTGGNTIGLRMPDYTDMLSIISRVGVGVAGPSANFHGGKTPYIFDELDQNLVRLADTVLYGVGKTGNVSTVVDCSVIPYKILRKGAIELNV